MKVSILHHKQSTMMKRLVGLTLALTLGVTSASRADAILLTSGTVIFNMDQLESFTFAAPGFAAGAGFVGNGPSSFQSGQIASLSTSNTIGGGLNNFGFATIDGVPVHGAPTLFFSGSLNIQGTPFVAPIPPMPPADGSAFMTFTTPAVLTGILNGFASSSLSGPPLFSVAVTGDGTMASQFRLLPNGDGTTTFSNGGAGNGVFTIEAVQPSPTPEPATIVLLAGGLLTWASASKAVRRRRLR